MYCVVEEALSLMQVCLNTAVACSFSISRNTKYIVQVHMYMQYVMYGNVNLAETFYALSIVCYGVLVAVTIAI